MPPSKRDELIEAAMKVFIRDGFNSTGIDRVIQEAGVSKMTLYNHFKSKDELIVAALRRRDETIRNSMMKFVEASSNDPRERILAVFGFHEQWFSSSDFRGCMFLNAASEFADCDSPIRHFVAEHKDLLLRYLRELCEAAGLANPGVIAEKLGLILEGAIVTAQVHQPSCDETGMADPAVKAREIATLVIAAA